MKKIIIYIFLVLAMVFVFDRLLNIGLDYIYVNTNVGQSGGKLNNVLNNNERYNLLILGSSRASHHIDPSIISKNGFNLGADGMESAYQLGVLHILDSYNKLPDSIILVIDETEYFSIKNSDSDISFLSYFYDKTSYVKTEINKLSDHESIKYLFKLYKYNGRLPSMFKNFIVSNKNEMLAKGYEPLKSSESDLERVRQMVVLNDHKEIEPNYNNEVFVKYKEIVDFLDAKKVKVVFVVTPMKINYTNQSINDFESKVNFLNKPFFVLDSTNENIFIENRFWKDLVHMNEEASNKFSIQLNKFLKKNNS